jgi:uncharacterized protein (DUF111 family)
VEGELCTPTGAALLRHFTDAFDEDVVMTSEAVGYGMGKKDLPALNCLRAFLGETKEEAAGLAELACNLDDMTPEAVGFAEGLLFGAGALDVFATPIQMKKNRPATMLTCLCAEADADELTALLLKHTTTAGVRRKRCGRFMLKSSARTVETRYGDIRVKVYTGGGVRRAKPEYDDVARAALERSAPFDDVYRAALAAYEGRDG